MSKAGNSELIISPKGNIYHLDLKPSDIADTIILVGDPGRVATISGYFDSVKHKSQHREFISHTGIYKGKEITVLSTGIGTDNIDIVVNELDALVNFDFQTREIKKTLRKLTLIRLGTSGAIQSDIPTGTMVMSEISIGFDGLLNFYANREKITDIDFENSFIEQTGWNNNLARPYITKASDTLIKKFGDMFYKGITISAPGFYGPQGRVLRLKLETSDINSRIENFRYKGKKITNFEMESSAIYGLSNHLGHDAITICAIIANRVTKEYDNSYQVTIRRLIELTLNRLVN